MNIDVYQNKRVLITGHTGFKGSWLALWLRCLGADVYGYSLEPATDPSNYALSNVKDLLAGETIGDIRNRKLMSEAVESFNPDVIFHLAAQPLVRASYALPYDTFDVNVLGTASLLDAVRNRQRPCAVVCITTDKCYENREQVWGYRECDALGGYDPYSASKGAAEILISSYRRSFFAPCELNRHGVQLASVRAGNVVGGGDWACDRIVTDVIKALAEGVPVAVRNPHAIRPWQHVLEPLSGYLKLGAAMLDTPDEKWSSAWNFGPVSGGELSVGTLTDAFVRAWGTGSWEDQSNSSQLHEASVLRLSIDKATAQLCWYPRWNIDDMVSKTVRWYRAVLCEGLDARSACENDIEEYGDI